MNKTIWFINDYAGSKYHGMEFRNYYFAKEFVKLGYKVYIISASYMHLFKKLPDVKGSYAFEEIDGINYLWLKVPNYGESTDKKRVLKWFVFSAKLFNLPLKQMKKPDFVIASPMAPFLTIPAYRLAKKFDVNFIYEIKDIWPLSIIELGNISENNLLIKMMSWCEKFAVKKADMIVSSLQNYGEHLQKDLSINKDFLWVNNGVNLEEIQNKVSLPESIQSLIPKDKFIIGYTGTIGIANTIDTLCQVAKEMKENTDILFVIVGDGKEKTNLLNRYRELDNILFVDPIPKAQVQSMLALFDVCYIGWRKEKIYKYGISANKIFDYMYSAKPILHAYSGEKDIIALANCGISVEAQNIDSITEGIEYIYRLPQEERDKLGKNGKKYVLEHFTYEKLARRYAKSLEEIL